METGKEPRFVVQGIAGTTATVVDTAVEGTAAKSAAADFVAAAAAAAIAAGKLEALPCFQ